jgi:Cu(I)/Ag(I) efflux system membrane fusion protein
MKKFILIFAILANNSLFAEEREVLYWVAPMDPNFRKDSPGKSPMGMDLVPVYADEVDAGPGVKISPIVIQNLGIRTQKAKVSKLWRAINTVGTVIANPNLKQTVQIHTQGWVKKLYVNELGAQVKKGDVLFTLQSHELVNAEEDFLQVLSMGNKKLITASENRLLNFGMNHKQINELRKTRKITDTISILSPQDGFIDQMNITQGMFIKPTNHFISIVNLSELWVKAEIVENKSDWLQLNQPVDINLVSKDDEVIEALIDYIYPFINPKSRTVSVRMSLDNKDHTIKPNMFAQLKIYTGAKDNILVIPSEAVIRSGQSNRVMVAIGEGRFAAKTVRIGIESGDFIEIISGLNEGDDVVVSGQFLLDSEASLKSSIIRMSEKENQ